MLAQMQINWFSELFLNSFAWLQHLFSRNTAAASVTHSCPAGSDMFPHSSCTQDRESFLLPKKAVQIQSLLQRQKKFRGWQCLPCFAPASILHYSAYLRTWNRSTFIVEKRRLQFLLLVVQMSDSPKSTSRGSSSLTFVPFLHSALRKLFLHNFVKK